MAILSDVPDKGVMNREPEFLELRIACIDWRREEFPIKSILFRNAEFPNLGASEVSG